MAESIDWDFIASLEGKGVTTGYVPDASGSKSGVTIATGFDLGQRTESDLTNLGLSAALVTKLKPYLGLKAKAATDFLAKNPLTITDDESKEIDNKVRAQNVPAIKTQYLNAANNTNKKAFDDLPAQAQTVIASVSFQYGTLSTRTPKFWEAVTKQDWVESVKLLRNFGDSYPTRRGKEADLLEQLNKLSENTAGLFARISLWNAVLLIALFGISCNTGFTQTKTVIFDANLAKAYKNYDASVVEKRQTIEFESGAKATNCSEYWQASEKSTVKEDIANQLYHSEYLECDALRILKKSAGSGDFTVADKSAANYGREIYSRLDLGSFPSSMAQMITDKKTFEQDKDNLHPKVESLSVVSDTEDWNFAVQVAAATDANNNGKPDLIIYIVDESKGGNQKSYSTLVIYDVENKGDLKAVALNAGK